MKKKLLPLFSLLLLCLLLQVTTLQAQLNGAVSLLSWPGSTNISSISGYEIFTSAGAITNAGKSIITGSVGSNAGAIGGFTKSTIIDATNTAQAATDLTTVIDAVTNLDATAPALDLELGGITLSAASPVNVYEIPGAASLTGTLTLSGRALLNATFIFKVSGAMVTAANATIILNGINPNNVIWLVQGAVTLGAASIMNGNIISAAAISAGANCAINGRLLSSGGAIDVSGLTATNPVVPLPAPYLLTAPDLTITNLSKLTFFTSAGALADAGRSYFSGQAGTGSGTVTGFKPANIASAITDIGAVADLAAIVSTLNDIPVTPTSLGLELGGQVLGAGVYAIPGAASLTGTLTLTGDASSVFIFQVSGAMATAAMAQVNIGTAINPDHIFWQVQGAVALGAGTSIAGNIISSAAIAAGANCIINGRLLTTAGAITISAMQGGYPGAVVVPYVLTAPDLTNTSLSNLVFFTNVGAVSDAGVSTISGLVGTGVGAITGFPASAITTPDIVVGATADLAVVVATLNDIPTIPVTLDLELGGQSLSCGVYAIPGAASLTGTLTLTGDANSVFIFQVNGALSTAANAQVILDPAINPDNIFWQVQGAVALGAGTVIAGNFVGIAAISAAANCTLTGRFLSTAGAIAISGATANIPVAAVDVLKDIQVFSEKNTVYINGSIRTFKLVAGSGSGMVINIGTYNPNIVIASAAIDLIASRNLETLNQTLIKATSGNITDLEHFSGPLNAGIYSLGLFYFSNASTLILNGDANSVFIFKTTSFTITNSTIILNGGVLAKNVYWLVNGDIEVHTSNFVGTVVATSSIIFSDSQINGNLYSLSGQIVIVGQRWFNPSVLPSTRIGTNTMTLANLTSTNSSEKLSIYPNPNHGKINVNFTGDKTQVAATQVYDANMNLIYSVAGYKAFIDLQNAQAGTNFIYLKLKTKAIAQKFVLLKN